MSSFNLPPEKPDLRGGLLSVPQQDERKKVFVHPGQFHIAEVSAPTLISCMLGSCVEVCLWDRKLRTGGAVHYLLPGEIGLPSKNSGVQGIGDLAAAMQRLGSKTDNVVAKVFGGACMLEELRGAHVGDRNVHIARAKLSELRIPILMEHVGGERGRRVRFLSDTGETTVEVI
jgi:chemotaxis protein CheD